MYVCFLLSIVGSKNGWALCACVRMCVCVRGRNSDLLDLGVMFPPVAVNWWVPLEKRCG